jgi:hypothetical protein
MTRFAFARGGALHGVAMLMALAATPAFAQARGTAGQDRRRRHRLDDLGDRSGADDEHPRTKLKTMCRYDDSLDVFGVHGIGGATGTILAGVFAVAAVGDTAGLLEGNGKQVLIQLYGVAVTLAWSGVVTFVLLKVIGYFLPLRVREEDERIGLDVSLHGESLQ